MQINSKRILWVDACKFVAISLVVIGHIVQFPFCVRETIFAYHMPFFFALSGIFVTSSKQFTNKQIVKKIKTLIIPYFCFGIILIGTEAVYGHLISKGWADTSDYLQTKLLQLLAFDRDGKLWFLPCLFASQIILLAVYKVAKDDRKKVMLIVSIIFGGGLIISKLGVSRLPFSLDIVPIVVGFLYIGSYFPSLVKKLNWIHIAPLALVFAFAYYINNLYYGETYGYVVNMCQGQFGSVALFTIAALSGSIVTLYLSCKIKANSLLFWGQNTLIIYGLHNIFKDIYPAVIIKALSLFHLYAPTLFMDCIVGIITFALLMLTMIPIINIINKRFQYVLGRV